MKKSLFIIFLFLVFPSIVYAACSGSSPNLTAASASQADCKDCFDIATYGDTINIPAGEATWTNSTAAYKIITITKDVKIKGAGVDSTIINMNLVGTSTNRGAVFYFTPDLTTRNRLNTLTSSTGLFEISGITFKSTNRDSYKHPFQIVNSNTPVVRRIRIHNNKFETVRYAGTVFYYVSMLFDNNTMVDCGGVVPYGYGWQHFTTQPMAPGAGEGIYMEDNTFSWVAAKGLLFSEINRGHGVTFRYNDASGVLSSVEEYFEIHGNQYGGIYGPQLLEVYGNELTMTGASAVAEVRGGKNIYVNNIFTNSHIDLWEELSDLNTSATNPVGRCVENQGTTRQTCTDSCICQKVHGSYFLNNRATVTGALRSSSVDELQTGVPFDYEDRYVYEVNDPLELVENKEFFNTDETFDGTVGCGCGAALPNGGDATGYTEGGGFFVTDQSCSDLTGMLGVAPATPIDGTLYRVVSGSWEPYWIPYAYPHPLRNEAVIAGTIVGDLGLTEFEIVSGGQSFTIELNRTTWAADVVSDAAKKAALIAGITGNLSEAGSWNSQVTITNVTRTSDTVVTIVLPASAGYDITARETVSAQIAATLTATAEIIYATPTIVIDIVTPTPPSGSAKASVGRGGSAAKGGAVGTSSAAKITGN